MTNELLIHALAMQRIRDVQSERREVRLARRTSRGRASLVLFFVLAYALTWTFWIPAGLQGSGRLDLPVPGWILELLGGLGPMLAAIFITGFAGGGRGVRALFRQLVRHRVGAGWYLVVFLLIPALGLTDLVMHAGSGRALQLQDLVPLLLVLPVHFTFVAVAGGGLDEEMGWRGFALPRLQARTHPVIANLLLGVLWSCWHLPLWFIPGTFQSAQSFPVYLAGTTASALLLAWIYNGTGGSLLLAILAHAAMDATDNLRVNLLGPISPDLAGDYLLVRTALEVAVALLIIGATRGRLGADRDPGAIALHGAASGRNRAAGTPVAQPSSLISFSESSR